MSLCSYLESKRISEQDHDFDALIMAAMRKADTKNLIKLRSLYPETWDRLQALYHTPGALDTGDS